MTREIRSLIALQSVPSLGTRGVIKLLERAGSAEGIFSLSDGEISAILGKRFTGFKELRSVLSSDAVSIELDYMKEEGIEPIVQGENSYPGSLKNIYDPPPILFSKGTLTPKDDHAVAIVGARRCSLYGTQMAEKIAYDLASAGVTIISGLARGIDSAAHLGALKAGGRTIAVMGAGFRNIYPPENKGLLNKIAANGCVLTEFSSGVSPLRENFPRRNRIVSGMVKGVIVVEAALKSGALITADFALEHGKEVFAVPGRADQATCAGSNRLIQSGAKLVMSAGDVLEEIGGVKDISGMAPQERYKEDLFTSGIEKELFEILEQRAPVHIDEILEFSSGSRGEVQEMLLRFQLKGAVKEFPGKVYEVVRRTVG